MNKTIPIATIRERLRLTQTQIAAILGMEPVFSVDTPLYSDRMQQTIEALEISRNQLSKAVNNELYKEYIAVASKYFCIKKPAQWPVFLLF